EGKVIIKNNTKKPLTVKLPETFAAMPVLAQRPGGGNRNNNNQQGGGQNQTAGGGMGGMGGGMGGGGGGFMSIPPEQVSQFQVATVCLEHGKNVPRAAIPYAIKPLEMATNKPEVRELLAAFGHGGLDQRAVQAAAWHLENGLSWNELANKRVDHLDGQVESW